MNRIMKLPVSVGDGNAAVIGLMLGMLFPASTPWWAVLTGTFVAIIVGKIIYGGIGCNPFNPALVAVAILILSWKGLMNFDQALVNYDLGFIMLYPLGAVKHFGASISSDYGLMDLFMGRQAGGIGSVFGLGLIIGGIYLILRGFIRWEISLSLLAGVFFTALLFNLADPEKYAGPVFHLFTGYTLIGAFFLATEDSSSPVNFIPMIVYGLLGGIIIVLIRNIGSFMDGTVFAILLINVANPIIDKVKPKAMGKGIEYA
jgi:electron transport complex protein RnfD